MTIDLAWFNFLQHFSQFHSTHFSPSFSYFSFFISIHLFRSMLYQCNCIETLLSPPSTIESTLCFCFVLSIFPMILHSSSTPHPLFIFSFSCLLLSISSFHLIILHHNCSQGIESVWRRSEKVAHVGLHQHGSCSPHRTSHSLLSRLFSTSR